ncbi:coiled-coil domain-containing protein 174-like [Stegodyphus dumicola]|uniref:coiled-coil domain-containing protein 174-like n=1 Tax=Stegodyphus dumicola TaxID=202533 RepID=UPI0015A89877|nr:coiled-coil domain-containing protein 174-like [Stegodyphus dumicola]
MDLGNSNLNPSSIIDLKAELHKRYELFKKAKLAQSTEPVKRTPLKNEKKVLHSSKEKKIIETVEPVDTEEKLALEKSRLALEAKAKLYEKITSNKILIDEEESERYLVDFQRKVLYDTPVPEVVKETVDSCNSPKIEENTQNNTKEHTQNSVHSFEKSNGKKSELPDADQPVHYQNVRYNEVREHGTGYFAFSTDEAKRKEQMEELISLRQETEEQRNLKQRLQRKRKAMLEARLTKICERRNINSDVIEAYTSKGETEKDDVPEPQTVDLTSIPLPETKPESRKKEPKIRPWDIGKTDLSSFVPEKREIKSQNEYIEERRNERLEEFAPPSFYK